MTSVAIPVTLPRWQWRTISADLSDLIRRFPAPLTGAGKTSEETHLVCVRSNHHASLRGDVLELRWRKEIGAGGFELWDVVIDRSAPFDRDTVRRLWEAWGLRTFPSRPQFATVAEFLDDAIAAESSIVPVRLRRQQNAVTVHGVSCLFEQITLAPGRRIQTLRAEHEDPALLAQFLSDLGLRARDNVNLLQGLKAVLGLQPLTAGESKWPAKSNANTW